MEATEDPSRRPSRRSWKSQTPLSAVMVGF